MRCPARQPYRQPHRQPGVGKIPGADSGGGATATSVPERDDLAPRFRWNLGGVFGDVAAWESACARVERLTADLAGRAGALAAGPEALAEVLALHAELGEESDRVYVWAHLKRDEDTRAASAQGLADRAGSIPPSQL